jgi:Rha family phage regulatory protein
VLEEIENLDCSAYFRQLNFELSAYTDDNGKSCPCYTMTREGFICLTSSWTEDNAGKIRYYYIHVFNDIEALIGNKLKQRYKGGE